MHPLGAVNRLLVALGSSPHLTRQDFPYEPDIYPFPFNLEPLSRVTVAKYVYAEGTAATFAANIQRSPEDEQFRSRVLSDIGALDRPNHVGSLYRNVLDLLSECSARPAFPLTPAELEKWQSDLRAIMAEGEHDHFAFFRQVYEGRHPAFAKSGVENVWNVEPDHEAYPSHPLPKNPTAYVGHPDQIASKDALGIAWLSNLHYWLSLCCLDFSYRYDPKVQGLSTSQMMSALLPLAIELPRRGAGPGGADVRQNHRSAVARAIRSEQHEGHLRAFEGMMPGTACTGATPRSTAYGAARPIARPAHLQCPLSTHSGHWGGPLLGEAPISVIDP